MLKNNKYFGFWFIFLFVLFLFHNPMLRITYKNYLLTCIKTLEPIHEFIKKPLPTDWLAKHEEEGETFKEWVNSYPRLPDQNRNTIYFSLLGNFTESEKKVLDLSAEFISIYFNLPVKVERSIPLEEIPEKYRRKSPVDGTTQYNTRYILYQVLKPNLPKDAAAYFAITPEGLWPGPGWNYVHGEASLYSRVAVSSLHGYGNAEKNRIVNPKYLLRVIKVMTHETGHMFSMKHCIKYECNMCGSNNIDEMDRKPLWLCPECLAKTCWLTKADPKNRFQKLAEFCKQHGLEKEYEFYIKSLKLLENGI